MRKRTVISFCSAVIPLEFGLNILTCFGRFLTAFGLDRCHKTTPSQLCKLASLFHNQRYLISILSSLSECFLAPPRASPWTRISLAVVWWISQAYGRKKQEQRETIFGYLLASGSHNFLTPAVNSVKLWLDKIIPVGSGSRAVKSGILVNIPERNFDPDQS